MFCLHVLDEVVGVCQPLLCHQIYVLLSLSEVQDLVKFFLYLVDNKKVVMTQVNTNVAIIVTIIYVFNGSIAERSFATIKAGNAESTSSPSFTYPFHNDLWNHQCAVVQLHPAATGLRQNARRLTIVTGEKLFILQVDFEIFSRPSYYSFWFFSAPGL